MRVLIPNHFPLEGSGSGIYTLNVARELVNKGHNALVITPAHELQLGYPFEIRSILFSPGDSSKPDNRRLPFNFPCFTTHPRSTTTYGDLDEDQRAAYIEAFQDATEAAVKEWTPEVIHAQHLWVTAYAASKTGIPYMITAHGTDLMGFTRYPNWQEIALEGARGAHAVIAISHQVAEDVTDLYGIPQASVRLIMNGFDESIFRRMVVDRGEVLQAVGISDPPKTLISFVGKLTEFKGVDVLLEAAADYESILDGVMTLIIGDGELHDDLIEQADQLALQNVHFLGHQAQSMVARLFNTADVSVVPSRVEPFGLVAIEAMACGTPVIATNEGGLVDFVDKRVGQLVDVDDPEGLADAIVRSIETDAKARKGAFAAHYALENFSWSKQVDEMISVYHETLEG
jgi:glycosyltransferase involved in cell wall biosynthesis